MARSVFTAGLLMLTLILSASVTLAAQDRNNQFQLALRLMQQQRYADALPLLEEVYDESPANQNYTSRLIECYIQLKQYDKGLETARAYSRLQPSDSMIPIQTGELYHYMDDTDKAREIWFNNIKAHPRQLQIYINTGQTMIERQEYLMAVDVYRAGRSEFDNQRLFFGDIANAYMRAGEYENATKEWLDLLKDAPNQAGYIKRTLRRYNDPVLYDVTIIDLDERLQEIPVNEPIYGVYFDLQIWLLQENQLFRRALAAAREYEERSSSFNYALFNLGRRLAENEEFDLARQAFTYYIDKGAGEVKWSSMHELARSYTRWAKYLSDYNLDFTNKRDSLYGEAQLRLERITAETRNYSRINAVHALKAEIALDHLFDLEKAKTALADLKADSNDPDAPEISYIEGRIHLAQREFPQARIKFTKANKSARIGSLAEKNRYFLALSDFYSGDFEFAKIQLKSLGRQNTSLYANDALKLRLWLQEGTSADSTGALLRNFAEAVYQYNNGQESESSERFEFFITGKAPADGETRLSGMQETGTVPYNPLRDDALLFYTDFKNAANTDKLVHLTRFLNSTSSTPLQEKLLWEQARTTEILKRSAPDELSQLRSRHPDLTFREPAEIYESLILNYPQGFYAPYSRERLNSINRENS